MVFRQLWVTIAVLVTLVGIGTREPAVAAMGILVLLTGWLANAWNRFALERMEYRRTLASRRAFAGETLEVTFSVVNRKPLPVPWLEIVDNVPEAMPLEGGHVAPSSWSGSVTVTRNTSLAWYQRVVWRMRFDCPARGYFHFGPATLRSGDPFGFFKTSSEAMRLDYVTVLPHLYDLTALGLPTRRPFGEERGGSPIFEDPSRLIGVRDYRAGDPLKRIEWKATARRGALQSRVYEPSSSLYLLVALNVTTLEYVWEGYDPVRLERSISLAGSAARWAHEHRYAVGLVANSSYPGADRAMSIPAGRDPDQLTRILEALAMVSPLTIAPLEEVLEEAARRLPLGATIVLVAAYCHESLAATLHRLQAKGYPLAILWAADDPPPTVLAGLNIFNLAGRLKELERTSHEAFARPIEPSPEPAVVRD
ncbi:MAG: DUF58 domain-containing protein [Dehalococcoidia bacterium]